MTEAGPITAGDAATARSLEEEIRALERRLRDGEEILRTQRAAGGDRELLARWEQGWIKLLRQYELLCDRLYRQTAQRSHDNSGAPPGS
ncbi:MAG: hypothetical protein IRY83_13620 [Chloroflexi bacterium]|nr:hypothetical protein [Chloroflexota bacterium]